MGKMESWKDLFEDLLIKEEHTTTEHTEIFTVTIKHDDNKEVMLWIQVMSS